MRPHFLGREDRDLGCETDVSAMASVLLTHLFGLMGRAGRAGIVITGELNLDMVADLEVVESQFSLLPGPFRVGSIGCLVMSAQCLRRSWSAESATRSRRCAAFGFPRRGLRSPSLPIGLRRYPPSWSAIRRRSGTRLRPRRHLLVR